MSDAPEQRRDERTTLEGDHFALVQMPSGEERLEPLLDLSPRGLAILLRTKRVNLQPGTLLPRVRLFTGGECTLDIQASVREVSQVTLETGGVGTKVGLALEQPRGRRRAEAAVDSYEQHQMIADAVLNLVNGRADAVALSEGAAPTEKAPGGIFSAYDGDERELSIGYPNDPPALEADVPYDIHGHLFGTRMAVTAFFKEKRGDLLVFDTPTRLTVWRSRQGARIKELPKSVSIAFETPFTRDERAREVVDVATRGAAFVSDSGDSLMVGMVLPRVTLKLPRTKIVGRGIVRNVRRDAENRMLTGIEFTGLSRAGERALATFIDRSIHPRVRPATVEDLRLLWAVYGEAGALRVDPAKSKMAGKIQATRQALLTRGRNVLLALVGGPEDEIEGVAELLRSYSDTWTLQHVGILPESRLTPDQLVVPLVETALRRRDFVNMHLLLHPADQSQLEHLRTLQPDPDQLMWREWHLVSEAEDYEPPVSVVDEVLNATGENLDWVIGKIGEQLSTVEIAGLALTAREMSLAATERHYRSAGLERKRVVRMAMSMSGPLGFSLVEQSSAGLNLQGFADLVRIVPTGRMQSTQASAALTLAHDAIRIQRERGRTQTLLLVPPELVVSMVDAGFVDRGLRVEVIASRDAAPQVVNFINLLG